MSTRKTSGKKDTPVKHPPPKPPPPKPPPPKHPPPKHQPPPNHQPPPKHQPPPPVDNRFKLNKEAKVREQPHGAALRWAKPNEVFTVHGLARRPGDKAEVYAEVHFGTHRRYIVASKFENHQQMLKQFRPAKIVKERSKVTLEKWQVRENLGQDAAIMRRHPEGEAQKVDALKPGHHLGVEILDGTRVGDQNGFVWISRSDHRVPQKKKTKSGKTITTFDHTGWIRKNEIEPQKKT